MKIVVGGGRFLDKRALVFAALDAIHFEEPITRVAHGGCEGADALADEWAETRGIDRQPYFADWKRYGNPAGPIRNQEMLEAERPDAVIALPGGRGTKNLVERARMMGLRIIKVEGG